MADNTVLVAAISVVGGGGIFGGIVALIKVRPESGAILVKSATDVVVIQREAMTDMQRRLTEAEQRADEAERERDRMRRRVEELEASVATLQRQVTGGEGDGR